DLLPSHGTLAPTVLPFARAVALLAITTAPGVPARAAVSSSPIWARLELVENSAEGPAFDRCQIETILESSRPTRCRAYYGEARADSGSGWTAIRSGSGCSPVESTPPAWTLRGSPYFLVDVMLGKTTVAGHEVLLAVEFSIQKLTGFGGGGAPEYET